MARRFEGLTRALGGVPLASVAYGEIGSSLYFALGVVALYAVGVTPWVLLAAGLVFLVVAFSYAEGAAAIPEPGGAALFVRRAFNDVAGFVTGWVLLLDYVIVIALAALFVPHYLAAVGGWDSLRESPRDVVVAVGVILGLAAVRLVRRPQLYALAIAVAGVAVLSHVALVAFALPDVSIDGLRETGDPSWDEVAFALPLAMLAYTGLETVANLAAEAREPGRTLPRSLFAGIGAVVVASVAVAIAALAAHPVEQGETALATAWSRAPLAGVADEVGGGVLVALIGLGGVVVLLAAVSTSMSGAGRLAYSLARHGMLPHAFERLTRRTLLSPASIVATAVVASALLVVAEALGRPVVALATLYSFGVLLAFTAAQLAVVRLRATEPRLDRPFRAPAMPFLGIAGAAATAAIWALSVATHESARVAGPLWVAAGLVVFVAVRRSRGEGLLEHVRPAVADIVPTREGEYSRILVPLKLGPIGDEVLATAIKLAEERGSAITVLHVVSVPLDTPLDAELPGREEIARDAIEDAKELASEHGIDVEGAFVRARSIGAAVVEEAVARDADLILMGSSPLWRRQSRFFSPTVDYVLRKAPSEVMVVAFPQGVLDDDGPS